MYPYGDMSTYGYMCMIAHRAIVHASDVTIKRMPTCGFSDSRMVP